MSTSSATASGTLRRVTDRSWFRTLARVGYVAIGIVHLLLGYLAVRVATHHGGESDQSGALQQLTRLPGGIVVLWITVVGLFALCAWLVVGAVLGVGTAEKRSVRTISAAARAVGYGALGSTAVKVAVGTGASSARSSRSASATLLAHPGGQFLLGAIGLGILGVGVYFVVKGLRRSFTKELAITDSTPRRGVMGMGVAGYVAKGIAVGVMGILFVVAAFDHDSSNASGLDGALKTLATLPAGAVVLIAVGIGLACYGVYNFARARYARL